MEPPVPPKPPITDLPGLFSSEPASSEETVQRDPQQRTLPSASPRAPEPPPQTRRGHDADVAVLQVPQVTVPSGQIAQSFRPSPAMQALGGEVLDWSPPRLIRVRYPAHEGWVNAFGSLSAGFVVAMFEPVMAALAYAVAPTRQHAILETSSRFFRQIRGGHVIVDATMLRAGNTTATVECIAWDPHGELCAKGSATLLFVG